MEQLTDDSHSLTNTPHNLNFATALPILFSNIMSHLRIVFIVLVSFFVTQAASSQSAYIVENAFPELSFSRPVDLQHPGDGTNRLFVVEQHDATVRVFENDSTTSDAPVFLDLGEINTANEEGFLGLAFHPEYATNGYFFVYYSMGGPRRSVISRFSVDPSNPNLADPTSELIILEVNQPYSNHNGGQLAFGPDDGYLYIGLGDGGDGGDPQDHGENPKTLLGSILRIDVNNSTEAEPYAIPADNPFVGNTDEWREEIFAYGLRNPWRFSFDPPTGNLWAGDVGQRTLEEINLIEKGKNYGWDIMEGTSCFEPSQECNMDNLEQPIWEYVRSLGRSVTGGYVYRGERVDDLVGKYIYADYITGNIWALSYDGVNPTQNEDIVPDSGLRIAAFGVSEDNSLYICAFNGSIYRISKLEGVSNEDQPVLPQYSATLGVNYPNPFRSRTTIPFTLGTSSQVDLAVYDVLGRRVKTLMRGTFTAGLHTPEWVGVSNTGDALPGGVYFYRLLVDDVLVESRMMTMVR